MIGLWRQGEDGRRVLESAGLSLKGREVHCQTPPGAREQRDPLKFWKRKLQHLEEQYATFQRPTATTISTVNFVYSDSEVEEDNAEQARADEYLRG